MNVQQFILSYRMELKKLKFYPELTQETPCFTAEIWCNSKKICTVENRGTGGCNNYSGFTDGCGEYRPIFEAFKNDCMIMQFAEIMQHMKKKQSKNIMLLLEDEMYTFKLKSPISALKGNKLYKAWIRKTVSSFSKDGYTVLNTNL